MHFIEGVIYAYRPDVIMTTIVPLSRVCRDHTRRRARVYLSKHLKTSNTRRWPNVFSHEELIVLRFTKFETFRINFIYAGNFTLESVNRQLSVLIKT